MVLCFFSENYQGRWRKWMRKKSPSWTIGTSSTFSICPKTVSPLEMHPVASFPSTLTKRPQSQLAHSTFYPIPESCTAVDSDHCMVHVTASTHAYCNCLLVHSSTLVSRCLISKYFHNKCKDDGCSTIRYRSASQHHFSEQHVQGSGECPRDIHPYWMRSVHDTHFPKKIHVVVSWKTAWLHSVSSPCWWWPSLKYQPRSLHSQ